MRAGDIDPPVRNAARELPEQQATRPRSSGTSILGLESEPTSRSSPPPARSSISGPSFLGLDEPADPAGYLLEDEEPRSHWRAYVVVLVLLLVGVLAGLQWRNELKVHAQRVGAVVWARMHPPAPQPKVEEPVASGTPSDPQAAQPSAPAPGQSAGGPPLFVAEGSPQHAASEKKLEGNTPAGQKSPAPPDSANALPSEPSKPAAKADESGPDLADAGAKTSAKSTQAAVKPKQEARRPPEAVDDSMLLLAQKYLQGRGVSRNCEQGLLYLRQAVRQPSARARSQMGALYATGTCVPQNRVEAYRWFSSALEVDPSNPWLARERDILYGEMSSLERQQISR